MPTTKRKTNETEELAEQMTPVHWQRQDKLLCGAILLLLIANLVVSLLVLGPDLWG